MFKVSFDNINSFDDWGLILSSKTISFPKTKTKSVDADGINGVIDLSEVLTGTVQYDNRDLKFTFTMIGDIEEWSDRVSQIAEDIHGKKMKISGDYDGNYYYIGRCSINKFKTDKNRATIEIDCDCEPFKYAFNGTGIEDWLWDPFDFEEDVIRFLGDIKINGTDQEVDILGASIDTVPVFNVTRLTNTPTVKLGEDGTAYTLILGRNKFPELQVGVGKTSLFFSGDCELTIEYHERKL